MVLQYTVSEQQNLVQFCTALHPVPPLHCTVHTHAHALVYTAGVRWEQILSSRDERFDFIRATFPEGGAERQRCWPSEGKEAKTQYTDRRAEENKEGREEKGGNSERERRWKIEGRENLAESEVTARGFITRGQEPATGKKQYVLLVNFEIISI